MFIRKYLKPYWKLLTFVIVLALINQVFSLLDPQIYGRTLDKVVMKFSEISHQEAIKGILMGVFGLVGVAMVSRIAKNFQDYFVNVMTQKIGMQIYQETIRHAFSLPYAIFEDQSSGQLIQKLIKARTDIETFIKNLINIVFVSVLSMAIVVVYAFTAHWLVGTIFAVMVPILMFSFGTLSKRIKKSQTSIVKESAALAGTTTESIRNVSLIKLLGLERQEMDRLETVNKGILGLELHKIKVVRTIEFIQGTLINAIRVGVIGTMFYLIMKGELSVGQFMTLMIYSFWVIGPMFQFGEVIKNYQEAKASMETLDDINNMTPKALPEHPQSIKNINTIGFNDVSFSYAENGKHQLNHVSRDVHAGETIAFVGPSGSGKSTIIKLLAGLYSAQNGKVLVNDIDINNIDQHAYAQRLGIVTQDTQLFNASVRDNLLFVAPDATDEKMHHVLKQASIDSVITESDKGLDTVIGESGIKLSGGQRQRLAIARALLRDPDILIFDEATSALDSIIEKEITETIKDVSYHKPGLITLLIAHRLSTVMHADKIFVLEKGHIIESGNHTQLLEQKGLYGALWRQQIGEGE